MAEANGVGADSAQGVSAVADRQRPLDAGRIAGRHGESFLEGGIQRLARLPETLPESPEAVGWAKRSEGPPSMIAGLMDERPMRLLPPYGT